jgi:hypothetical protein
MAFFIISIAVSFKTLRSNEMEDGRWKMEAKTVGNRVKDRKSR